MRQALYLCAARALVLQLGNGQWRVTGEYEADKKESAALGQWLLAQKRRSVLLLLDLPGETLTLHELPAVGRWQRRRLLRNLAGHLRGHCSLFAAHQWLAHTGGQLREFAYDQSLARSVWYPALSAARNRLRVIYAVALLAEQSVLPALWLEAGTAARAGQEHPERIQQHNSATGALLCVAAGEGAVRHSFFWSGQLLFTRVLDHKHEGSQLQQQLSESRQYLKRQFAHLGVEDGQFDLIHCVANDLPLLWPVDQQDTSYRLLRDGFTAVTQTGTMVHTGADASGTVGVSQTRLFDFIAAREASRSLSKRDSLQSCRLRWPDVQGSRRFGLAVQGRNGAHRTAAATSAGVDLLLGVLLAIVVFSAVILAWSVAQLDAVNDRLGRRLSAERRSETEAAISPELKRDVVLLHQALPADMFNPMPLLLALGQVLNAAPRISLATVEWTAVQSIDPTVQDLSPRLRSRFSLAEHSAGVASLAVLRVAGQLQRQSLSIGEAYSEFERFASALENTSGFDLLASERLPFDSATATSAGAAATARAGRFSLLFAYTERP